MKDARTLEKILNELDQAQSLAATNADEPQYARTRAGIQAAIQNAIFRVEVLKEEYAKTVLKNGIAIFLYGPADKTLEFANAVSGMGEAVAIDSQELYKRIADIVEPAVGRDRSINSEHVAMMHRLLMEISKEVGVWLSRAIDFPTQVVVKNAGETLEYVRDAVRGQLGDDLNSTYLTKVLAREALKIRYKGPTAPVLVLNATQEESVGLGMLFGKGRANVELSEKDEINEDFINKTFKNIRNNLKKQK